MYAAFPARRMVTLPSVHHLAPHLGHEVAISDWLEVTADRVAAFAEATGDRQWIHLDAERARTESPYGGPIAHGFLTLSLASTLLRQCLRLEEVGLTVNYGLNRVRFAAPVPVGARVRARFTPTALDEVSDATQVSWHVVMEVAGASKPCCVAEWIVRYHEQRGREHDRG